MQVQEVMTSNPTTCSPDATIVDVAKLMAQEDVGPVPIVDDENRLMGIVTDRDIVVRVVATESDPKTMTASEIATSDLVTISPDEDLDRALQLLAEQKVRRLPVVEEDRLVGIVAQADVAREAENDKTGEVVQEISEESS